MQRPHYDVDLEPLARGSQGTVYGATNAAGERVAIKVAAPSTQALASLEHEVQILQVLGEAGVQGVVPCLDLTDVDGQPAFVMPMYPSHMGEWLQRVLEHPGPKTLAEILWYASRVADALSAVHQTRTPQGTVVHRDVKPENVFLDAKGQPFLGDFGGAMAIEGLKGVELALFGTPMWAPLDQILPGHAVPDPTWDTYALCVMLYAAITGARPAYQANPTELLTEQGRELWAAARGAIEATGPERARWHKAFAAKRRGTQAGHLVDLVGRAALVDADREALDAGIERLCEAAELDGSRCRALQRGLWGLLVRGLSPVSHPSPPNRYRDARELAETLEDLRQLVLGEVSETSSHRLRALLFTEGGDDPSGLVEEAPRTTLSAGTPILTGAVGCLALVAVAGGIWLARAPIAAAWLAAQPLPDRVEVAAGPTETPAGSVDVAPFRIDALEATVARYHACVAAEACPPVYQRLEASFPALGLGHTEARALCEHEGGRLPTEAEWLRAAGDTTMPWGERAATCDRANALGCNPDVIEGGATRAGASPWGVLDLAGNAWEWVDAPDGPVLRGGSFASGVRMLGRGGRRAVPDDIREPLAGVRCAWNAD